ncbi:hypothetical protein [Sinorhizobium meliloti]|uniref:hypothetical protein n=1 Tax=Rhizobium meliloti TaxID=382 RepID=UPI000FDBD7BE|nr:hypothetical protein [Sinorhizobium meliloti]RVH92132.1 hypothetical protein CN199_21890 [Sinorhizobium meliloti]RVL16428.1 hypothetical protein CN143_23650 [Sinorhizobium meliloti]RVP31661.1 hypothetical protein CN081_29995 [Sinorhizobium meliloti]
MNDGTAGVPEEGGAATWEPLRYDPIIARASVRLRFVKVFPEEAKSWDEDQELSKDRPDQWLTDEMGAFERKRGHNPKSGGPGQIAVSRLWGNTYGVPNVDKATREQAQWALDYVDSVFKPVIGPAAVAVQVEMAEFVMEVGPKATALEQLNKFRKHYEGLVEALRACKPADRDACALISHYDEWVVCLVDLVNDGSGNRRHLRPDDKLETLVARALESKKALGEATGSKTGSPIVDLHYFQALTNELQSLCSSAVLPRAGKTEDPRFDLTARVRSDKYFEKLNRFLEIVDGERRVDEALHGLVVAATLGLRDKMLLYGTKTVRGLRRVLRYNGRGHDPDWNHPVLLMTAALFRGDPAPIDLPQLEPYFQEGHHAAVLAAESNLEAVTFDPVIEAALQSARRKWR